MGKFIIQLKFNYLYFFLIWELNINRKKENGKLEYSVK